MIKKSILLLLVLLCGFSSAFAVSEASVLFLLISPSPQANAMGQTYGTLSASDPMASVMNPAALGLYARDNYIGTSFYGKSMDWLPAFGKGLQYDAYNVSAGINLKSITNLPLSFGLAYHKIRLDLGEQIITTETGPTPIGVFNSWEKATGITFSLALDYLVRFSIGWTSKSIDSQLAPVGSLHESPVNVNAGDFGMIMQIPVFEIINAPTVLPENSKSTPYFTPSLYYSVTNIGDDIKYIDAGISDPLPRNLAVGYAIDAGYQYTGKYSRFNLFSFKWAREVNDMLVERDATGEWEYQGGFHDIDPMQHVFLGKAGDNIITKKGYEFNFADFYFVRQGHYEDIEGKVMLKTEGYGVDFLQPFKILANFMDLDHSGWAPIFQKLSFEMHTAKYNTNEGHPLENTKFTSYTIQLKNITLN